MAPVYRYSETFQSAGLIFPLTFAPDCVHVFCEAGYWLGKTIDEPARRKHQESE